MYFIELLYNKENVYKVCYVMLMGNVILIGSGVIVMFGGYKINLLCVGSSVRCILEE